jgi:hypothetical protein
MLLDCLNVGNGTFEHTIDRSSDYYIVVHSLNGHQDTVVIK